MGDVERDNHARLRQVFGYEDDESLPVYRGGFSIPPRIVGSKRSWRRTRWAIEVIQLWKRGVEGGFVPCYPVEQTFVRSRGGLNESDSKGRNARAAASREKARVRRLRAIRRIRASHSSREDSRRAVDRNASSRQSVQERKRARS